MTRYLFIVNPAAGRGRGEEAGHMVMTRSRRDNGEIELVYTGKQGEATELAKEAKADVVVAVGGDGTVNEVGNGLVGTRKKLGIIPAGSGNDLVKSLGIPSATADALQVLWNGSSFFMDVGRVSCTASPAASAPPDTEKFFFNGIGVGFDASVARQASTLPQLRGTLLYIVAVLLTIRGFRPPVLRVTIDGELQMQREMLLLSINNGRCQGGGFFLTPEAITDDGELDFCAIDRVPLSALLLLIPKVITARHASDRTVHIGTGRTFSVSSENGVPVHADGEVLHENAVLIRTEIMPHGLEVIWSGRASKI